MGARTPDRPLATGTWAPSRWATLLDRIEVRQPGIGLRFWGPPLWLQVTMAGPDADRWPAAGGPDIDYDWQSGRVCEEAVNLADDGAGDDEVLDAVCRYTVENLLLNAVHEIGEWLRHDGRRLFPAHTPRPDGPLAASAAIGDGGDGNGTVLLADPFAAPTGGAGPGRRQPLDEAALATIERFLGGGRCTYLAATSISCTGDGPLVRAFGPGGRVGAVWESSWSPATTALATDGSPDDALVDAAARDVHRAVVEHEADRTCRAFFVDGRRTVTLAAPAPEAGLAPVRVALTHLAAPTFAAPTLAAPTFAAPAAAPYQPR